MWWFIIKIIAMLALSYFLRPKPKFQKPPPSGLESFEIPTAEEGRPIEVLFGKRRISGPNVVWYGDLKTRAIKEKVDTGFFSSKEVTLGYKYYLGMHLILCYGNADGVKQIWVGEKVVWPGSTYIEYIYDGWGPPEEKEHYVDDPSIEADDGTVLADIKAVKIFGGNNKEGGIKGRVDIQYGAHSQLQNDYLVSKLGADISAYRGLLGVILNNVYVGTNAYIKPWSFLVKRTDKLVSGATQWYPTKAKIGNDDLNAIHMIRESLTDQEWGLGFPDDDINDDNFRACADVLYDEGFGLSSIWDSSSPIEDFIGTILEIIAGSLHLNMSTGKWEIKLIRDDYLVDQLESFDEDEIIKIEEFNRPGYGEIVNQVVVNWWDKMNNRSRSVMVHDCALIEKQAGNIIEMIFDYPSVCSGALANKIANRELKCVSSMLATFRMTCNRRMSHLRPGDVFKWSWVNYGISNMPIRILEADYGNIENNEVSFQCVEDVFGLAYTIYTDPPNTEWEDPIHDPVDTVHRLLMEVPYYILCGILGQDIAASLDDDAAAMFCCAAKPIDDAYGFTLMTRFDPDSKWEDDGPGTFTFSAIIKDDLTKTADDVEIELEDITDLDEVSRGDCAIIGDEIVYVLTVGTNKITIARGVLDTKPDFHSSGSRIWFVTFGTCVAQNDYASGDAPQVKFLTSTNKETLSFNDATIETASAFNSRMIRPYLPGNLKINDVRYPKYLYGQPTLTWSHRDRTDQNQLRDVIKQTDFTDYGPEAGTTYTLKIYDQKNRLLRTIASLTGTSYTYVQADEEADSPDGHVSHKLRFVLFSVRSGYNSLQEYDITVERPLYGHSDAQTSTMGNLAGRQKITGSLTSESVTDGDLIWNQEMIGDVISESTTQGDITES